MWVGWLVLALALVFLAASAFNKLPLWQAVLVLIAEAALEHYR